MSLRSRFDGQPVSEDAEFLCDALVSDGTRFGDEDPDGLGAMAQGRWPDDLDTDAVVRLAEVVGESPTWQAQADTPPVAQQLAERARLQPLDIEIGRRLQHLKYVCHRPRLHLRVEEERLPVSRARRIPVRAVADLLSHPGDWEHRTIRSIQPARVLARQIEDEWNLYENRVAVRLVDHLLAYLAKRLEELRRIAGVIAARRNYSSQMQSTTHWRVSRVSRLWSDSLDSGTEDDLDSTTRSLEVAQRDLQALLDTPLYRRVPRRQSVDLRLKRTNILLNDSNYRRVAELWRAWLKHGHQRQKTKQERAERRSLEATSWDAFLFHLVVRAFGSLKWVVRGDATQGYVLSRPGWSDVCLEVNEHGIIDLHAASNLRIVPLCTDFVGADSKAVLRQLEALDGGEVETVIAHISGDGNFERRPRPPVEDVDRATGWSFEGRTVLFSCSPWSIDSEERMSRLLQGWLCRSATPDYPYVDQFRELPKLPSEWTWLQYEEPFLVALRAPNDRELACSRAWATSRAKALDQAAQRAKAAKQAYPVAPRDAVRKLQAFVERVSQILMGLDQCPVCDGSGKVVPRPGNRPDGSSATWWATCTSCQSEWGTRSCAGCGNRYRALQVQPGLDLSELAAITEPRDWPDKVLGRDVWAQPCRARPGEDFRCPDCGQCAKGSCVSCASG